MDPRVAEALAEAPELVRYPEQEELARDCLLTVEQFIMTTRRAAAAPRRYEDWAERKADKKPVNKLAWSMMLRYYAWSKAVGVEPKFRSWKELNVIPYGDNEEEIAAERHRIMMLDVGDWVKETRRELMRLLGLAAVGKYHLKEKGYGSIMSRLLLDLSTLESAEVHWREARDAILVDVEGKVGVEDIDWEKV